MIYESGSETEHELNDEYSHIGYRPSSDKSLAVEIEKMRAFESLYPNGSQIQNTEEYRLHPRPFYFKLCPSVVFNLYSTELIKGMYLPLDYWEVLTKSSNVQGQRGGIRITYENVGRYINNTLFIELVQAGWIGSKCENTSNLTSLITHSLENGKSVIVAFSSGR